jgi:hypothetical protein
MKLFQKQLSAKSDALYPRVLRTLVESNRQAFDNADLLLVLIRARDWQRLYAWADSVPSTEYRGAAEHFAANQLSALVRKYPFSKAELPGFDPEATAIKKFLRSEYRCKWVNRRFVAASRHYEPHAETLRRARNWIRWVLGDEPDLQQIYELCDFGPGASMGVHGNATNIGRKLLAREWSVTPGANPYARIAMWNNPHMRDLLLERRGDYVCYDREVFLRNYDSRVKYVNHNKISFVPKTTKTHRSIAVEPLLNGFLQKGVDEIMRIKLRKARIDLRFQAPNQELARKGSEPGFNPFVTIDLSAASDSMSVELCRDLLPPAWFELLNSLRAHSYELNGEIHKYHKFASMGNGFCFPLETLIFASITHACNAQNLNPGSYRVYGDDIVCRQSVALHTLEVLRWCGFRHNVDKTFLFGPFRESCGEDWFEGQAVRPVYLDAKLSSLQELHILHNSSLKNTRTSMFWEFARSLLRDSIPPKWQFFRHREGPSDTAFTVPLDLCMSNVNTKWDRHEQRWKHREVLSMPVRDRPPPLWGRVEYLAFLRGSSSEQPLSLRRLTRTSVRWC